MEGLTFELFLKQMRALPEDAWDPASCPTTKVLNMIQGKWTAHILFFLCIYGNSRFGKIHKAHPQISKTTLSSVLKQLEADGLVIRRQFNEMPLRTEYTLTDAGNALMPIFFEMYKWGLEYLK